MGTCTKFLLTCLTSAMISCAGATGTRTVNTNPGLPDPMHDHIITLSTGRKLAYAEYGAPKGVPLFYFHGWPSSRLQGELLDKLAKQRGIRVIAPDRPGIGQSEFQPNRTLLDWPATIAQLAGHLGWEKYHILGVSGGGPYVLACAQATPERLLSAGVICGAPPLREVGTKELMWTYRLALWGQQHVPVMLGPGLALSGQLMRLPPHSPLMRAYASMLCPRDRLALSDPDLFRILMSSGRVGVTSGARNLSTDGNVYSSDWGFSLKEVSYPIHYWHGGMDKNIPVSMVQNFVSRIPNAKLTVLPEDGHYSLPLLCNEMILGELMGWQ